MLLNHLHKDLIIEVYFKKLNKYKRRMGREERRWKKKSEHEGVQGKEAKDNDSWIYASIH